MKEIIKSIVDEDILNNLKGEKWTEATFPIEVSGNTVSAGLIITKTEMGEQRLIMQNIITIGDRVRELVKLSEIEKTRWNKANFIIYPDGVYESTYSWDNEKEQQDYYMNCVATINWLYERLAEYVGMLQTNNFTKKVKRIQECKFTIDKKGDFFYISGYAHFEGLKLDNIIFEPVQEPKEENETKCRLSSSYIQDLLNNLYKDTHEDFLKDKWVISPWNHISMNITPFPMIFEQDIQFEFKPENSI